jgi:EAL domain-containing protein (putative c-di-GMP-specific phosphodiesterase class I)
MTDTTMSTTTLDTSDPDDTRSTPVVEAVLDALLHDRIALRQEPVVSVWEPGDVLYRECLSTALDAAGRALAAAQFVPALEASGLMGIHDRYVMRRVLGQLEADPTLCLGVNLNGGDAVPGVMWEALFERLAAQPALAARLVVEFTEREALPRGPGRRFAQRLMELGCRVAVDDFGAGHSGQILAALGTVDIVKIDGAVLGAPGRSGTRLARLEALVARAQGCASAVVVEGVERAADVALVKASGALWMQGYLFGDGQANR